MIARHLLIFIYHKKAGDGHLPICPKPASRDTSLDRLEHCEHLTVIIAAGNRTVEPS